jgi:hypothetical protein
MQMTLENQASLAKYLGRSNYQPKSFSDALEESTSNFFCNLLEFCFSL